MVQVQWSSVLLVVGLLFPSFVNLSVASLSIAQSAPTTNESPEVASWLKKCEDPLQADDYQTALSACQAVAAHFQTLQDPYSAAKAILGVGIALNNLNQAKQALTIIEPTLAIFRANDDKGRESISLLHMGIALRSEYSKAIEYFQQSLAIAREIKYRRGEAFALSNIANVYLSQEEYAKAIEYFQESFMIFREIKNRRGEGNTLGNIGNAYFFQGEYAKAIEYLKQSLTIAREIKNRNGEGGFLSNIGNAYHAQGKYGKAIEFYQQSLTIARQIKDRSLEGNALGNIGNAYN